MKWFKHDSNAAIDAKIEKLIIRYGLQGYGLYFYCLELVARTVEPHNLTFELEHDAEIIGHRVGLSPELIQDMMTYMIDLGLFENDRGVITCLKLAKRTDEYTQKLIKTMKVVPTLSGESPRKSELIEENRLIRKENHTTAHSRKRENAPQYSDEFLEAWGQYPKRAGGNPKSRAYKAWKARVRQGHTPETILAGLKRYANFCVKSGKVDTELVMQAATFFGPDENFLEQWSVAGIKLAASRPAWAKIPKNDDDLWDWAKRHNFSGPGTLTYDQYRQKLQRDIQQRLTQEQAA